MTHPTSFAEFNAVPATGPTYTELAREVEALKEENARLRALHGPDGLCQWHKEFQQEQERRIKAEDQVDRPKMGMDCTCPPVVPGSAERGHRDGCPQRAKDAELEQLRADKEAAEAIIAALTEQMAAVTERTLVAFAERDAEIERLKAELQDVTQSRRAWKERAEAGAAPLLPDVVVETLNVIAETLPSSASTIAHHISAQGQEIDDLRSQIATLISGQQRNGEARQQARVDMAHELAEMEPAARDSAIRRIIDNHEDKP